MRLVLLAAVAFAALVAHQRPDWVEQVQGGARLVAARLGDVAPFAADRRSTAARAPEREPDRTQALAAIGRAADAQMDAQAAEDPTARDRVTALLRAAAATMAGSEAMGEFRAMTEARARVADLRERAAAARIAGGDATTAEAQLTRAGAELARLTDAFVGRLAALGVPISRDAAENLAVSANGDDVVALLAAYANVERLEGELRASVAGAADNEALLRRTYAVHATLLAVLETVQAEVVSRIDNLYLPGSPRWTGRRGTSAPTRRAASARSATPGCARRSTPTCVRRT
ncbi:hypothetical protein ACE7GA_04980 [Roseomonas sp. CCTCC AB2023176]|uniref:hypothetical protein n=1 Tax=Roseomonas sp. CCTCC AB2023176 TaxID=3342640 RepID=UPI0035D66699